MFQINWPFLVLKIILSCGQLVFVNMADYRRRNICVTNKSRHLIDDVIIVTSAQCGTLQAGWAVGSCIDGYDRLPNREHLR